MDAEPAVITVRKNGSLLVTGNVRLVDHEGKPIARINDKPNIALCRCGQSARKPFCDGTHKNIGFVDPPEIDPAAASQSGDPGG
ncbi:MAG TPA: CDGSH iron-sulfur domain-containing protein [Gemmatimonadaceae bacterium]|nr:CDGSH iron-sulfur domain-containing protein [Gemmatimonadaceae bacterium]